MKLSLGYCTVSFPARMKSLHTLLLAMLLATLAACGSQQRMAIDEHGTEAKGDFSQLKTYRWDFSALGNVAPDGGHIPEFDRVVCEHVDKHLSGMGYTRVEKGPTDFTLDYRVVITQEEAVVGSNANTPENDKVNEYGLRWTFDRGESPSFQGLQAPKDVSVIYRNGTLHLAAFDAQQKSIWHSSATKLLNGGNNEAERRAAVRIAVDKLMKTFPAR